MSVTGADSASFSVSIEDIELKDWREEVYQTEIIEQKDKLSKQPGYKMYSVIIYENKANYIVVNFNTHFYKL